MAARSCVHVQAAVALAGFAPRRARARAAGKGKGKGGGGGFGPAVPAAAAAVVGSGAQQSSGGGSAQEGAARANVPISEWGKGRVASADEQPEEAGSASAALSVRPDKPPREIERKMADKLVKMFRTSDKAEWGKLVGFSAEWTEISESFLNHLTDMVRETADPAEESLLLAMRRRLRRIDVTLRESLETIQDALDASREKELESWVAQKRTLLTKDFFAFFQTFVGREEDEERQDALAVLLTDLLALCQAHDNLGDQEEAMIEAGTKLDLLLQGKSIQEMTDKLDEMGDNGELDAAFMLTMAKAHAGAKESSMVRDEAKDVMAHLYFRAKENMAKNLPDEVRILRHLISIEDPLELRANLDDAFDHGEVTDGWQSGVEGGKDYLFTTPARLLDCCDAVLTAFVQQRGGGSMLSEAIPLMNPTTIDRVRNIHAMIQNSYM